MIPEIKFDFHNHKSCLFELPKLEFGDFGKEFLKTY